MWRGGPGGVRLEWKHLYEPRRTTLIESMRVPADPSVPIASSLPRGELSAPNELETCDAVAAACDYCGSVRLEWRKCKLICADCKQINKSCADL